MSIRAAAWLLAAGMASSAAALAAQAGPEAPPVRFDSAAHQLVADTARSVVELIAEGRSYADEDPERLFSSVEALLSSAVDFEGFARRVMSVHYRRATPAQRARFVETFRRSLIRAYALNLVDFTDGEVVVLPPDGPPRNPKRRNVKTEIRRSGGIYPVVYTATLDDQGAWRIGNIIIAGVNVGLTYRSQFMSMAAARRYQGDIDRIIDAWAEFIAKGDGLNGGKDET